MTAEDLARELAGLTAAAEGSGLDCVIVGRGLGDDVFVIGAGISEVAALRVVEAARLVLMESLARRPGGDA
jgi:hypothetical protein